MSTYTRWYRDGSVSLTKNSNAVVGVNTYWLTAGLNPGDIFKVDGVDYEIVSITDNTHLTLAGNYAGTTGSDKAYAIVRNFTATTQARMAAQTSELLGDFAKYIDNDMQSIHGKSAYQIACEKGYVGTESEWVASLKGDNAYQVAVAAGYTGTREQWLESLKAAGELAALNSKIEVLTSHNSAAHNSIYRGKNLGTTLTAEQSAAIRSGTFDDIYIGDYWEMPGPAYTWTDAEGVPHEVEADTAYRKWFVLGLDYFYTNYPHLQMLTHHVLVWPFGGYVGYTQEKTERMNATDTTEGGYVGSEFFTNNIRRYEAVYKAIWGDSHLARYSMELCNAASNGQETGFTRYTDRICDLLTVNMVGGNSNRNIFGYYRPLPITIFNPNLFTGGGRVTFLQDVYNGTDFYTIRHVGSIGSWPASYAPSGYANPFCLVF